MVHEIDFEVILIGELTTQDWSKKCLNDAKN
jgi:hypothetical protein